MGGTPGTSCGTGYQPVAKTRHGLGSPYHGNGSDARMKFPRQLIPVVLLALSVRAGAASPDLTVVTPRGAQRGTEADLVFSGNRLGDAKEILFYQPGITVTKLEAPDAQHVKVHVQIANDAKLGEYPLRVRTATGLSELRTFYVTPFPTVTEKEPNNDIAHANPVELNHTVTGVIENEDVDYFVVEAKKGQRLTAEVHGIRLGDAMFDPYVAILNEKRFAIAECDDTALARQDPFASAIVPEDGKYYIQVRDTSYSGGGNYHYLLHVGTFPRPTAVFPPGGKAGDELAVKFLGDVSGEISKTIKLPSDPDDLLDVYAEQDGLLSPSPNFLRVSSFPSVNEDGQHSDVAHAQVVEQELPVAMNGIISKPDETDFWKFKAKKGQALEVHVRARALRSPLDSVLIVYNDKGGGIASNDDSGGPDSYLRFTPPADGQYVLSVHDQLHHGGPDFTYRVEITPVKPELTLQIPQFNINSQERNWVTIPRGNKFCTVIRATRRDFGGELKFSCPDLPEGVTMHCDTMANNVDVIPIVFEARPDAPIGAKLCDLTAQPTDGKTDVKGQYTQPVELVIGPNNAPMYTVDVHKLAVAVAEEAPYKLHIVQPKVPIVQGGEMKLKVVAERSDKFKGAINVRMMFNPPGVGSAPAVDIPPDKTEIEYPISCSDGAPPHKWKICVLGVSDVNGPMWASSDLADLEVAEPFMKMKLEMAAAEQGKPVSVIAKIEQQTKFDGPVTVKLLGLPPNATAPDAQITSSDQQVVFNVTTANNTPVGQHGSLFCQAVVMKDGEPIIHNLGRGGVLRVDAPPQPKKGEAPKPQVAQAKPQQPSAKPLSRLEKLRLEAQEQGK